MIAREGVRISTGVDVIAREGVRNSMVFFFGNIKGRCS